MKTLIQFKHDLETCVQSIKKIQQSSSFPQHINSTNQDKIIAQNIKIIEYLEYQLYFNSLIYTNELLTNQQKLYKLISQELKDTPFTIQIRNYEVFLEINIDLINMFIKNPNLSSYACFALFDILKKVTIYIQNSKI